MRARTFFSHGILTLALLLAGCSSAPTIDRSHVASGQPSGLVLISFSKTGNPFAIMGLKHQYRSLDGSAKGEIEDSDQVRRDLMTGDGLTLLSLPQGYQVPSDRPWGVLRAIELPAGDYEFYSYSGSASAALGTVTTHSSYRAPKDYSLRFRVEPGQVAYIGNINMHFFPDKSVRFMWSDQYDRDAPLFKKRLPEVASKQIENRPFVMK